MTLDHHHLAHLRASSSSSSEEASARPEARAPVKSWLDSDPFILRKLAASRGDHEAKLAVEREEQRLQLDASAELGQHAPSAAAAGTRDATTTATATVAAPPHFVPPLQFDLVAPGGIYRSGHPNERNFAFLRSLRLRSIVYLGAEDYRANMRHFAEREGIAVYHYRLKLNKEPFDESETCASYPLLLTVCLPAYLSDRRTDTHASHTVDEEGVAAVLALTQDAARLPMLLHCNKGKYRVGCLVGCLRKLHGWLHSSIFDEYARFAGAARIADQEFIETFDVDKVRQVVQHQQHQQRREHESRVDGDGQQLAD